MFETYAYETMICTDCTMAVANADYSGMDAETEIRVVESLINLGAEGARVYLGDTNGMVDFYRPLHGCGVCRTTLAGSFYPATIEKN